MPEKKELNDEELNQISGGDELEDAIKQSLKDQEQERINNIIEDIQKNKQERNSKELNDVIDNMIDMLKKLYGHDDDDSDGQIHIG